jgi:hypothetical protein
MTLAGWIFMLSSMGVVMFLAGYCYYRVLSKPSSTEHMHSPLDIDTGDIES